MSSSPQISSTLDQFIPDPAVRGRHSTIVRAPAAFTLRTAFEFDMRSVPLVRAIFWLRAKILGAKGTGSSWSCGFREEMQRLGWGILVEEEGRWLVAGAVCQPWIADVVFTPIPAAEFAAFAEPDRVKIVWTLEAEALDETRCRFSTETRAVGTDPKARTKFRSYWRRFGIGIVAIRLLLMPAIRREAERRFRRAL
jgi:hypothetical protein